MSSTQPYPSVVTVSRRLRVGRLLVCLAGSLVVSLLSAGSVSAQSASEGEELPKPIELTGNELTTKDGVALSATYLPGTKGKETVPVILLHMSGGSRKDYVGLASYLQKERGYAVLVPDLRGHGTSTGARAGSSSRSSSAPKLSADQYSRMARFDMETLKAFLMQENNAGKLNIEKLCVVGAEMGASVAMDWARLDWSWPAYPGLKQGQDVKALVLISPTWNFPGMDTRRSVADSAVRGKLSIMIIVGRQNRSAYTDASRLFNAFERYHPEPPEDQSDEKDLYFGQLETTLQGTKMLGVEALEIDRFIALFIDRRVVRQHFPWQDRQRRN